MRRKRCAMRDLDNNEFQDAVVFRGTPVVSAAMTVFFFGMLLLSAVMFKNLSVYIQVLSIVGIPIILWGTMRWVRIVCRGKQVILAIGKRGIFDWRLSDAWIPWTAIAAITKTNEAAGYKNVVPRNFRGVVIQL